ncbi:hypothetical protein [Streptomyces sp. NPDC055109]
MTSLGRPFRLHLPHQVLDGWELADGQALVIEADGLALTSAATTSYLLRGYGGGQLEWLEQHSTTHHQ